MIQYNHFFLWQFMYVSLYLLSHSFPFFFLIFLLFSKARGRAKKKIRKRNGERMRQKRDNLHELPYTFIVKSGTNKTNSEQGLPVPCYLGLSALFLHPGLMPWLPDYSELSFYSELYSKLAKCISLIHFAYVFEIFRYQDSDNRVNLTNEMRNQRELHELLYT